MYHHPTPLQVSSILEWRPDVERLRSEIEAPRRTGDLEHLAIAEAECWIDLIDAELSARRSGDDPEIGHLRRWRWEIKTLLNSGTGRPVTLEAQARRT